MESNTERDPSTIDNIFFQIMNDIKDAAPIWEDFILKSNKLHSSLRLTIQSMSAYLDVFQKIADTATHSKGASKEIGTVLTRVCLRQKSVESKLKLFASSIMDTMIIPLQNQLEKWHRDIVLLERNYTKDQKRSRAELKKHSTDTIRLKKKTKKCQSDMIQSLIETSMMTINHKHDALATLERAYLRDIMIEERNRFCVFVNMLQPIVKDGCNIMFELGHLQEAMDSISNITQNPKSLPATFENSILQLLGGGGAEHQLQSSAHISSSNTTLGSRKNSASSLNSSVSNDSREIPLALSLRSRQNSTTMLNTQPWNISDASSLSNSLDLTPKISLKSSDGSIPNDVTPPIATISMASTVPHRPPLPIRCSSLDRTVPDVEDDQRMSILDLRKPPELFKQDNSCDQHTYVNTLDMDFSRNCSKLSYSTPMESNQPNASILKSDTAAFQSIVASNGDDDIGNAKSSTTDSVCLNGIVEKKLSIFERIKLLNNDATARGVTSKDYNIPEIRFKQEPESAVKFREKSNDEMFQKRSVSRQKPDPPVRRSSSVTPRTSYSNKTISDTSSAIAKEKSSLSGKYIYSNEVIDKAAFSISPILTRRHLAIDKSLQTSSSKLENPIDTNHHHSTLRHLSSFRNNTSADIKYPASQTMLAVATENKTTDRQQPQQPYLNPKSDFAPSVAELIYATPNDLQSSFSLSFSKRNNDVPPARVEPVELLKIDSDLSRKAVAVRKLINRKALADPRQCHESLMSQIKMGTILNSKSSIKDQHKY